MEPGMDDRSAIDAFGLLETHRILRLSVVLQCRMRSRPLMESVIEKPAIGWPVVVGQATRRSDDNSECADSIVALLTKFNS